MWYCIDTRKSLEYIKGEKPGIRRVKETAHGRPHIEAMKGKERKDYRVPRTNFRKLIRANNLKKER